MFQFPPLTSLAGSLPEGRGVAPFGYPRIKAFVRLPVAFRSFTRPSSSGDAKASTIRPCVTFAYMACTASHITMTLDLYGCQPGAGSLNRSYLLISYESISFTMSKNIPANGGNLQNSNNKYQHRPAICYFNFVACRLPFRACGATGIRTPDPLLAKQVL